MKKSLVLLAGAMLLAAGCNSQPAGTDSKQTSEKAPDPAPVVQQTPAATTTVELPAPANGAVVKAFVVDGRNFAFTPKTIEVNKGDKVKITFKDDEGFHDLVLDGYNMKTNRVSTGGSDSFEFTADKTGTFAYYCSVGNHREQGMEGVLTVK